jgi:hypothetical protein
MVKTSKKKIQNKETQMKCKKPKIRGYYSRVHKRMMWQCGGNFSFGFGRSPVEAYKQWEAGFKDSERKYE